jgi:hypothetical protein
MNGISAEVCSPLSRETFVPLTAPEDCGDLRFRDAMSYRHWAEELAESTAPQLDAERLVADFPRTLSSEDGADTVGELAAAIGELGILSDDRRWRFDEVVARACATFGVRSAYRFGPPYS